MVNIHVGLRCDLQLVMKFKRRAKKLGISYTELMRVKLAEIIDKEGD